MDYVIVTNNRMIEGEFTGDDRFELVITEKLPDLLQKCMELVDQGCELAVDPLAGYLSRFNPFHTIILKRGSAPDRRSEAYLRDMSKLDVLLSRYWLNRADYSFNDESEEHRRSHEHVDASIGRNSIMSIFGER